MVLVTIVFYVLDRTERMISRSLIFIFVVLCPCSRTSRGCVQEFNIVLSLLAITIVVWTLSNEFPTRFYIPG